MTKINDLTVFADEIGLKLGLVTAGILGAVAGLAYMPKSKGFSIGQRLATVVGGAACATYGTPLVSEWFSLGPNASNGMAFVLGSTGMNILGGVIHMSERFKSKPIQTVRDISDAIKGDED